MDGLDDNARVGGVADRLSVAHKAVDDAMINVARAAQELSDEVVWDEKARKFLAPVTEVTELRTALRMWKEATEAFLKVAHERRSG